MIGYKIESLADKVFEQLEFDILTGKYAAGEIISENRLSEELGVSRTPIREAMGRLMHEKLIKDSTMGTVVVGVNKRDILDLLEIKKRIEELAVKRAVELIDDDELALLEENVIQQEYFVKKEDADKVRDLDTEFHDLIYKASRSLVFEAVLVPIHHKLLKFRKLSLEKGDRIFESVKEHRDIFEAISKRDIEKATELISFHICNTMKNFGIEGEE